ncbi:MAG: right-handed parallel beta-helix repeat-containing protein, partial [Candidatus Hydrogenedentes bacterium]|nr:right-handed parallel beta-helix repeat-containing protein [Candidatus Hydrogenedentota bacterium]
GGSHIVIRRVRTEWTRGPNVNNGAYGIYPVHTTHTLIEDSVAIGASDAGIYVGQSRHVVVRNNRAEYNVAGIEIENCHGADVINNVVTNNTGGLLVFDLPDLPVQRGHDVRLLNNKVYDNNTTNFAPPGNIVGTVSTGTGVLIMANSNVEIFNNDIRDHATVNVLVVSYLATGIQIKDPNYYPYAEGVSVHDNVFGRCGYDPGKESGGVLELIIGKPLPDVIWDGVANPEKTGDEAAVGVVLQNNSKDEGEVAFANMGGLKSLLDPANAKVDRDIAAYEGTLPSIAPIVIEDAA